VIRVGLYALGIGPGARAPVVAAVARAAEHAGFARLWAGEHVLMVDRPASRYPYNDAGAIPVPADADWLDPFVCLSFAGAATTRIEIATGIVLLPEHNPVLVAKSAASLDAMSDGRFTLGVGIGWSEEEFVALGVPFARRGARTVEYVAAIREIWRSDSASCHGYDAAR
jgi:probable F420-dependent oxidoreductase